MIITPILLGIKNGNAFQNRINPTDERIAAIKATCCQELKEIKISYIPNPAITNPIKGSNQYKTAKIVVGFSPIKPEKAHECKE